MSATNTQNSWGLVARIFHWGMLALVLVQIPLGFWMVEVYEVYAETYVDDTWVMRTSRMHHTLGFLVLFAVVLRLSWRMSNSTPRLPESLVSYQRWLARATHLILYILLIVYPLSGWASLSAYEGEFPIFFFGWENAPRLVPQVTADDFFNYEFFAVIHRWCWRVGAAVLGLHVLGALWHQFVLHDGVLRRMWNGTGLSDK
jgi:cytochrome b561